MEEREFAKYAFLIVAIVAVVGLLTMGDGITGFAAKRSFGKVKAMVPPAASGAGGKAPPSPSGVPTPNYRPPVRRGSCRDNEQGSGLDIAGNITFINVSGERKVFNDLCGLENWMNDQSVADAGGATRPNEVLERYCEGSSIAVRWWTRCEAGCLNHNGACGQRPAAPAQCSSDNDCAGSDICSRVGRGNNARFECNPGTSVRGIGEPCRLDAQCATAYGQVCNNGRCAVA